MMVSLATLGYCSSQMLLITAVILSRCPVSQSAPGFPSSKCSFITIFIIVSPAPQEVTNNKSVEPDTCLTRGSGNPKTNKQTPHSPDISQRI